MKVWFWLHSLKYISIKLTYKTGQVSTPWKSTDTECELNSLCFSWNFQNFFPVPRPDSKGIFLPARFLAPVLWCHSPVTAETFSGKKLTSSDSSPHVLWGIGTPSFHYLWEGNPFGWLCDWYTLTHLTLCPQPLYKASFVSTQNACSCRQPVPIFPL